ncbi:MAG: alanine racemase [Lachnospiraceae bacterium]|nr:alanine racemase [Lachnospiraceae bacterium]
MNHPLQNTAYYTFDEGAAQRRAAYLKSRLPDNVSLCYAVKANPFLIPAFRGRVPRFELCSPGEARIAQAAGVPSDQTVISGLVKTSAFLEELIRDSRDRIYTVESLSQWEMFCDLARKYQKPISLLLRLTNDSQFGLDREDLIRLVAERENNPLLEIRGLQFFSGTQKSSLKKIRRELEALEELLDELEEKADYIPRELEYGPGFPVSYFEGEEWDEEAYLEGFSDLLNQMRHRLPLYLELGRSLAASCGNYYTFVADIKRNKGQNYLLVDGGMHHLVYYGQYMAMKQPRLFLPGREREEARQPYHICGALCSMNDILAKAVPLPEVKIGELLCFPQSGAYCVTEGIALFLSRELPAVYLIDPEGGCRMARPSTEAAPFNTEYPL